MTPGQQKRKDWQDEARRLQQADEKIRELEAENKRLREALRSVAQYGPPPGKYPDYDWNGRDVQTMQQVASDALDGGGGDNG